MGTMPQNFFPSLDKPYFRADVFYPDGYSINDVVKEMKSVEEHLAKQPEVKKGIHHVRQHPTEILPRFHFRRSEAEFCECTR